MPKQKKSDVTAPTDEEIGYLPEKKDHTSIDKELLRKLAHINCTYKEMAFILGCSEIQLRMAYSDLVEEERANGKAALKRRMWKAAMDEGNVQMMIFLAKNMLGYFDDPLKKQEALAREVQKLPDDVLDEKLKMVIELRKNSSGQHE